MDSLNNLFMGSVIYFFNMMIGNCNVEMENAMYFYFSYFNRAKERCGVL